MKPTLINTRAIAIALITLVTVTFTLPVSAEETPKVPVELKYIGTIQNNPVFELSLDGTSEKEFTVVIRDKYEYIVYKETLKGENISKKFMLSAEELDGVAAKFEITGKTSEKSFVFEVNKNSRIVEDIVINKIK